MSAAPEMPEDHDGPMMKEVALLLLDPDIQVRVNQDDGAIKDYTQKWKDGVIFPPIDVFFDGVNYRVADGFQRVLAARAAGISKILVTMHIGRKELALLFALKANDRHGVRLTNEDKRNKVLKALSLPSLANASTRVVADACLVSHQLVKLVRKDLEQAASVVNGLHLNASTHSVGADGKYYPATQPQRLTPRVEDSAPVATMDDDEPIESEDEPVEPDEDEEPEAVEEPEQVDASDEPDPMPSEPGPHVTCPHCGGRVSLS